MSFSPVLPLLALGSVGSVGIAAIGAIALQNPVAKWMHPQIPMNADAYPNVVKRQRKHFWSNHTIQGWAACGAALGATFVAGRIATQPMLRALRKKYIFIPGTQVPRRIRNVKDFAYDICPDVFAWVTPLAFAIPVALLAKVKADGAGRFNRWDYSYNPYDKFVKTNALITTRPEKPIRQLQSMPVVIEANTWSEATPIPK
eukprot:UN02536